MNIYKKLLEIKKQIPYLEKDKKKASGGLQYSYVTPEQVLGTINPLLNDKGIMLKTEVIKCTTSRIFAKRKGVDVYVLGQKTTEVVDVHETLFDLDLRFTWIDTEDGEKEECLFSASGVNGDEKGLGSALTYAERYFILKQFNIPTGDDDPDAFQNKFMSDDEKKALKEEVEKQAKAQQQQETEKRQRDLNTHIAKLANCKTVDELKTLKTILPDWVKKEKEFNQKATARFLEITEPATV